MDNTVYEIIRISDNSWRIEDRVVRTFLFVGTERALLVDSGFGTGNLKALVATLTDLPVMLLNTHADHDHTGGNSQFQKAYLHERELSRYRDKSGEVIPVEALYEGDVIDIGNRRFEVILTPGHTPGSIALLDREKRILIAGDSVQSGTIFMAGEGRDMKAYVSSLMMLCNMRKYFDVVYPSHGEFPVSAEIIPELIKGAEKAMNGEVVGQEAPAPFNDIAKLYDIGVAKIVF